MKRFKKIRRLIGLVLLITLAMVGIGTGGGIPVPIAGKRENQIEITVELPDAKEKDTNAEQFFVKY